MGYTEPIGPPSIFTQYLTAISSQNDRLIRCCPPNQSHPQAQLPSSPARSLPMLSLSLPLAVSPVGVKQRGVGGGVRRANDTRRRKVAKQGRPRRSPTHNVDELHDYRSSVVAAAHQLLPPLVDLRKQRVVVACRGDVVSFSTVARRRCLLSHELPVGPHDAPTWKRPELTVVTHQRCGEAQALGGGRVALCIGHFVEEAIGVDYMHESEVLTPADEAHHINKHNFRTPFALCRVRKGATVICTKGEAGTGNVVEAVRSPPRNKDDDETKQLGRLPVVQFAGVVATLADATLMMQLGCDGVFVGTGIFKSGDPVDRGGHGGDQPLRVEIAIRREQN
ncbi:hypothetical protein HU200_023630 [Digitaria exilis]|uniref:PdxS/SNZ N-terminal domain-containing protein n=1 Tax=Digitaria exilis TaxID=1010633 RepID=A0A835C8L7_9POAL|nr:hypothetical protein HU200_023630 [Digitaria exilis]